MSDRFSLYFPFQLPETRDISSLPHSSQLAGKPAVLKENAPHLVVEIHDISTEGAAKKLFGQLLDAMHWVALDRGVGITFSRELDAPFRPADPIKAAEKFSASTGLKRERLDIIVDGGRPYVRKDSDQVLTETALPVGVLMSQQPELFARAIDAGLDIVQSAGSIPQNIRLACEVFSQTHFLSSGFARFQALFIPLEIAAPKSASAHQAAVAQVGVWSKDLRTVIDEREPDDPVRHELEMLASRLGQLAKESHTTRIRNFVREKLAADGHQDADEQAEAVERLYRKRGTLTHEGSGEFGEATHQLEHIVRLALKAGWRHP